HRKAEARTQMINQAYQTLSDPFARTRYDATTRKSSSAKPSPPSAPPRPQPTPRPRQEVRGPHSHIILSRPRQPKIPVPAILMVEERIDQTQGRARLSEYLKIGVMDFLDAVTLTYGHHAIFAETREEAEERVANLAAMHYAYFYAEQEGLGRSLSENDL